LQQLGYLLRFGFSYTSRQEKLAFSGIFIYALFIYVFIFSAKFSGLLAALVVRNKKHSNKTAFVDLPKIKM